MKKATRKKKPARTKGDKPRTINRCAKEWGCSPSYVRKLILEGRVLAIDHGLYVEVVTKEKPAAYRRGEKPMPDGWERRTR